MKRYLIAFALLSSVPSIIYPMHGKRKATDEEEKTSSQGSRKKGRRTPEVSLHSAAENGRLKEVMRFVTEEHVAIDTQDDQGRTALHLACLNGHFQTAAYLCKHDASTWARDTFEETPLHLASHAGHARLVGLMISCASSVNVLNKNHETPLHLACMAGSLDSVKILVTKGRANVNAKHADNDNATPLHYAVMYGHIEVAQWLLEHGANLYAQTKRGLNVLGHLIGYINRMEELNTNKINAGSPNEVVDLTSAKAMLNFLKKEFARREQKDQKSDASDLDENETDQDEPDADENSAYDEGAAANDEDAATHHDKEENKNELFEFCGAHWQPETTLNNEFIEGIMEFIAAFVSTNQPTTEEKAESKEAKKTLPSDTRENIRRDLAAIDLATISSRQGLLVAIMNIIWTDHASSPRMGSFYSQNSEVRSRLINSLIAFTGHDVVKRLIPENLRASADNQILKRHHDDDYDDGAASSTIMSQILPAMFLMYNVWSQSGQSNMPKIAGRSLFNARSSIVAY